MTQENRDLVATAYFVSPAYRGIVTAYPTPSSDVTNWRAELSTQTDPNDRFEDWYMRNTLPTDSNHEMPHHARLLFADGVYCQLSHGRAVRDEIEIEDKTKDVKLPVQYNRVIKVRFMPSGGNVPPSLITGLERQLYTQVDSSDPVVQKFESRRL